MDSHAPQWPFSVFQHVCLYVKDMAETEKFLRRIGIPLFEYKHMEDGHFTTLEGMSEEALRALGYKHALIGDVHFQIMAPGSHDTLHKRLVAQFGNGAYSVGWLVDDVDAAERELTLRGLRVKWKGRHENGWGFTYFDTFDALGIFLCVRQNPRI